MKKLLLLFLLIAPAMSPATPVDPALDPAIRRIADAARWEISAKRVPSIAIALVDRDGLIWADAWGFADAERRTPASPTNVYRAGSVSKLFTDVAVMMLVESGSLDLDAPVTRYLPEFRPHNPFGGAITLRHLMTHRSGLVREPPRGHYFDTAPSGQLDAVLSLNETTLAAAPGTVTKYSNAGIAVVGEVVARIMGVPYEQAIQQLILEPLGMNSSGMSPGRLRSRIAHSEMASFDGPRFAAPPLELGTPAAGSLYTTVGDLARFAQAMLNRGAIPGGALLRPGSVDEMWRPQFPVSGTRAFGLGFVLGEMDGQRMLGHSGAVYGHATDLRILPDAGIAVVVFSTVDSGNSAGKLAAFALRSLLAARQQTALPSFATSEPVTGAQARRLSGWFSNGTASVVTRIFNGQLILEGPETAAEVRRSGDRFILEDAQTLSDRLEFAPDGAWVELAGIRYQRRERPEPPQPAADLASVIGEYGWDYNILRLYERDGQPYVRIEWVDYRPLTRLDADRYAFPSDRGLYPLETLTVERDASGAAAAVLLNGIRFPRRDFGAEVEAGIRATVRTGAAELRRAALAASPPAEPAARASDLVPLAAIDPTIRLDIRYAGTNNFMGVPLYESAAAYMQRPAAQAIARANQALRNRGYGLLIHDAYRPWFVTKMFWDATPPENRMFVADPMQGSRHNRGAAVDLTMLDLRTGEPVIMPGRYDEFSSRSYSNHVGGSDRQRWLRDLLRQEIEAQGFSVYPEEWWHFDFAGWRDYPISNDSFEQLGNQTSR